MMESVQAALAVLSLLSVAQSAPVPECENLTKTIDIQKDQLLGRWIYISQTTDVPVSDVLIQKFVKGAQLNVINGSTTDTISSFQNQKGLDTCLSLRTTQTLKNNTLTMEQPYPATDVLLRTSCPDCLVLYSNFSLGNSRYTSLSLLSRRNKLATAEMDEFRKQVSCLNLPPPSFMEPQEEYCPDPSESHITTDITEEMNKITSDQLKQFDEILRNTELLELLLHAA